MNSPRVGHSRGFDDTVKHFTQTARLRRAEAAIARRVRAQSPTEGR